MTGLILSFKQEMKQLMHMSRDQDAISLYSSDGEFPDTQAVPGAREVGKRSQNYTSKSLCSRYIKEFSLSVAKL